ncbi:MAG: alpha/beta hydrolase [Rhodocyclales bacterium]|nr:alpha/beta hydrolase [Rhodocyclales bacterium]
MSMFLTKGGCRLWFERWGCGPQAVVFLHDLMMSSCVWAPQIYGIQGKHGVCLYTFDFRGFGRSDKPGSECSVETLVEDLRFMLGELDIQRPILVGAGMGATVAMSYAASAPGAVSGLVLMAATPCLAWRPDFKWGLLADEVTSLAEGLRSDFSLAAAEYARVVFPETRDRQVEGVMRAMRVVAQEADPVVASSCLEDLAALDLRPMLPRIGAPVSVVNSASDRLAPVWVGGWLANALGANSFLVVPAAGHAPYLTAAQRVNKVLSSVLSGFATRASSEPVHELAATARRPVEVASWCSER